MKLIERMVWVLMGDKATIAYIVLGVLSILFTITVIICNKG